MPEQYANVTVWHGMHGDRRFDLLAQLAGWSRPEACWRMVELWSRCTALQTDRPPAEEIRIHLGMRGEQLLVEAVLGQREADGSIRVLGGGLTGGDTDRFGWYRPARVQQREAGLKRAANAVRNPSGKFVTIGDRHGKSGAGARSSSDPTSASSGSPATPPARPADHQRSPAVHQPPDSGFRIPEDQNLSPARAIPPSTAPAPAAPAERQEARQLWRELEQARAQAAAELGVENHGLPFGDRGERDLADRIAAARERGPAELARAVGQARHAIAMAKAETVAGEKAFEWFTGAVFSPDNFRRLVGKTATPTTRAGPRGSAERARDIRKLETL